YRGGERKFLGFRAKIGYSILTRDLERIDELLIGVIEAGADELGGVSFQTSRLKSIRENVRKEALLAARRKAEIYAEAAGVSVGSVCEIEDLNPSVVSGDSERGMHSPATIPLDEDVPPVKAIDPGAIVVGAAVNVKFEIV
ncbi:MAG: SIMPL domain-containing protein, partial [Planctomycetales bacterium]|nr:SIMPL domain-containing protein [Planctomycetales bacterium]